MNNINLNVSSPINTSLPILSTSSNNVGSKSSQIVFEGNNWAEFVANSLQIEEDLPDLADWLKSGLNNQGKIRGKLCDTKTWKERMTTRLNLLFRSASEPINGKTPQEIIDIIEAGLDELMTELDHPIHRKRVKPHLVGRGALYTYLVDKDLPADLTQEQKKEIESIFFATYIRDCILEDAVKQNGKILDYGASLNDFKTRLMSDYPTILIEPSDLSEFTFLYRFERAVLYLYNITGKIERKLSLKVGNLLEMCSDTKRYIIGGRSAKDTMRRLELIELLIEKHTPEDTSLIRKRKKEEAEKLSNQPDRSLNRLNDLVSAAFISLKEEAIPIVLNEKQKRRENLRRAWIESRLPYPLNTNYDPTSPLYHYYNSKKTKDYLKDPGIFKEAIFASTEKKQYSLYYNEHDRYLDDYHPEYDQKCISKFFEDKDYVIKLPCKNWSVNNEWDEYSREHFNIAFGLECKLDDQILCIDLINHPLLGRVAVSNLLNILYEGYKTVNPEKAQQILVELYDVMKVPGVEAQDQVMYQSPFNEECLPPSLDRCLDLYSTLQKQFDCYKPMVDASLNEAHRKAFEKCEIINFECQAKIETYEKDHINKANDIPNRDVLEIIKERRNLKMAETEASASRMRKSEEVNAQNFTKLHHRFKGSLEKLEKLTSYIRELKEQLAFLNDASATLMAMNDVSL